MLSFFSYLPQLPMKHTQEAHPKKHFSEEETLDKVEHKIDRTMDKIMNQWFVHKFLSNKIVKDILNSHFANGINHSLQPYLKTIFTVIGRISLITWIVWIFSFLISLSGIGFMFSLWVGLGIRVLVYMLLSVVFSLLSLFMWIGMLRFKRRVPSLVVLWFAVTVVSLIVSLIPVGLYSYRSYGSFWWSFFKLLIILILLIVIMKNEHMFKN